MVEYYFQVIDTFNRSFIPRFGKFKGITGAKRYAVELLRELCRDKVEIWSGHKLIGEVVWINKMPYFTKDGMKFTPINMDGKKSKSRPVEWEI